MGRIAYLSDTHIDFFVKSSNPLDNKMSKQIANYIEQISPIPADMVIVAGDIGHYNTQNKEFLIQLSSIYKNVLFTLGNHDLYLVSSHSCSAYKNNSYNRVKDMKEWAEEQPNIHYLDGQTIELEGLKISGLSMWYDYTYGIENFGLTTDAMKNLWKHSMNDYNYIVSSPKFDPLSFYSTEKDKLDLIGEVDIMVSHFGPLAINIPPIFHDATTGFYYFDGKDTIERIKPKIWIYGHTHKAFKHKLNEDTILLCNPMGYPNENPYKQMEVFDV